MSLAQVCDEVRRALPEISVRALEAKELRQLRARQIERQPGLEADQHGFREEADRVAGANQPGGNGDRRHHERGAGRESGVARRITCAQLPY